MSVDYDAVKQAVENERALMQFMLRLSPEQWSDLMQMSRAAAAMRQAELQAERQKRLDEHAHKERLDKESKADALQRFKTEQERAREQKARDDQLVYLRAKEEQERRLIDYNTQKQIESEQERTRQRLLAEEGVKKLTEDRIRMERDAMEYRAQLDYENQLKLAPVKLQHDKEMFEHTKSFNKEKELELRKLRINEINAQWEGVTKFFSGDGGRERLRNLSFFVGSVIGVYFTAKVIYPSAKRALKDFLFKPTLVTEYQKHGTFFNWRRRFFDDQSVKPVLNEALQRKMDAIQETVQRTHANGLFFANIMLYGPPGTGKTLWARRLSIASGMDFAIMSGPSFDMFSSGEAIQEIKSLFKWAKNSRGLLLFVDEAETFLEDRRTLTPEKSRVLNEWISQTGTESKRFMVVYATNRPEVLDSAVLSRVARGIEFPLPGVSEVHQMLKQFFELVLEKKGMRIAPSVDLGRLAHQIASAGFSGRDVMNLTITIQQTYFGKNADNVISEDQLRECLDEQIEKKRRDDMYEAMKRNHLVKKRD